MTIGAAAEAHGNHDTPATWWTIPVDAPDDAAPLPWDPIIVYDAVATADGVAYATLEGIALGTDARTDLIESRAIRFITG